jgi:hypothetical protein
MTISLHFNDTGSYIPRHTHGYPCHRPLLGLSSHYQRFHPNRVLYALPLPTSLTLAPIYLAGQTSLCLKTVRVSLILHKTSAGPEVRAYYQQTGPRRSVDS